MTVENQIKTLYSQLYPTGRAWNFARESLLILNQEVIFTDGQDNDFTDGQDNDFISQVSVQVADSNKVIIADTKVFIDLYKDVISILDIILPDNDNFDFNDAQNWERVLGLISSDLTLDDRKSAIERKLTYPNGIKERATAEFIQNQLQTAGFNLFIQENRFTDGSDSWNQQNPDDIGLNYSICANYIEEGKDNLFFQQEIIDSQYGFAEYGFAEYDGRMSAFTPTDLIYIFFIGGETFPSIVNVPLERKTELRQLILKLKPAHSVAIMYVNYI